MLNKLWYKNLQFSKHLWLYRRQVCLWKSNHSPSSINNSPRPNSLWLDHKYRLSHYYLFLVLLLALLLLISLLLFQCPLPIILVKSLAIQSLLAVHVNYFIPKQSSNSWFWDQINEFFIRHHLALSYKVKPEHKLIVLTNLDISWIIFKAVC